MNRRTFLTVAGIGLASFSCAENARFGSNLDNWENLSKAARFEKLFQDGYSFNFKMPKRGVQTVAIAVENIGEIALTSGKIIAWDPLMGPDLRYYLTPPANAGSYPVLLSLAAFQSSDYFRVAAAKIVFSKEPAVKWEVAPINEQKLEPGAVYNYGVDSGTGSFMDYDAARLIVKLSESDYEEKYAQRIIAEMEKNENGKYRAAGWANFRLNDEAKANIVTFHAGWGDGGYISYWGLDKTGQPVSLITDFDLFYSKDINDK